MAISYIWLKDQLKGEYLATFDKAELYASVRNIDSQTDEEMMMNLLDLLLTAQKEEKPVEKIIGSDIETFCHSYFEDYGLKNRLQKLPKKIYHLMQSVFVLELIELFFSMDDKDFDIFQYHTDLSGFIAGFTIATLLQFSFFLIVVILEAFDNGLASAAILGLLLFISQIPLIFFFRIMQFLDKLRQQLLDECEQNGINILEYVEMKTVQTDTTVPEAHRDA